MARPPTPTLVILIMQYPFTLSVVVALGGCFNPGPHVQLRSPPASTAPLPAREAAYEELRPREQVNTLVLSHGQPVAEQPRYVMLRDGRRIYHADDLGAVVPAQSATAQAAQRSKRAGDRIRKWQIAGYTLVGVGMGAAAVSLATSPDAGSGGSGTHTAIFTAGLLVGSAGVAMAVFGALSNARDFVDERSTAFALYDEDLRKGLDLCVVGTSIVACDPAGGGAPNSTSPLSPTRVPFPTPAAPAPVPPSSGSAATAPTPPAATAAAGP